jgi:hypothetical protein
MIFLVFCIIIIAIFFEWLIGYAIGNAVSKDTGIVLGIILILFGFSIIIGITIIVCSQKNKSKVDVNINLNMSENNGYNNIRNITPNNNFNSYENKQMLGQSNFYDDQKKCPFCAETIKKEAIVCRFCGRDLPKEELNHFSDNVTIIEIFSDDKNIKIERLEKLFDSTTNENEKGIIAKKLYDLGKMYYWRFIPR